MLVLSRKESDKIVFPTVGITVEVLRIQGNSTRIGIDAPSEVPIYRHEIADLKGIEFTSDSDTKQQLSKLAGAVRQRLDSAAVALNRLHQHFDEGADPATQDLILDIFHELKSLEREASSAMENEDECQARALLVEADANERGLLASYLRLRGIDTTTATDGQEALDYLSLHAVPDVVLLDMHTPRCNGPCLVRNIRSDAACQRVKLFAVSSDDPRTLGIPTGPQGIDRWFPKPVDPEQLAQIIAEASETGAATAV